MVPLRMDGATSKAPVVRRVSFLPSSLGNLPLPLTHSWPGRDGCEVSISCTLVVSAVSLPQRSLALVLAEKTGLIIHQAW